MSIDEAAVELPNGVGAAAADPPRHSALSDKQRQWYMQQDV